MRIAIENQAGGDHHDFRTFTGLMRFMASRHHPYGGYKLRDSNLTDDERQKALAILRHGVNMAEWFKNEFGAYPRELSDLESCISSAETIYNEYVFCSHN